MNILRHHLIVTDRPRLVEFYCRVLGMQSFASDGATLLGYNDARCLLKFTAGATLPCSAGPHDFYWKIGITVADLDAAVAHVREQGWPVSAPVQFQDIGYLCHLRDPDGFAVELLQQGFQGAERPVNQGHPIGSQATLAHLTLRITDIDAARRLFEDRLHMRLMSVQPVDDFGFCLYFYTWSDETMPLADLQAVESREWLWKRPYALIELQHLQQPDTRLRMPGGTEARLNAIGYAGSSSDAINYVSASSLADELVEHRHP